MAAHGDDQVGPLLVCQEERHVLTGSGGLDQLVLKAQRGELAHAHREMEAQLGIDVASDGGARAPWQLEEAASPGSRHENTRLILISTHHVSGRCDGRLGTSSRHSATGR